MASEAQLARGYLRQLDRADERVTELEEQVARLQEERDERLAEVRRLRAWLRRISVMYPDGALACSMATDALEGEQC